MVKSFRIQCEVYRAPCEAGDRMRVLRCFHLLLSLSWVTGCCILCNIIVLVINDMLYAEAVKAQM